MLLGVKMRPLARWLLLLAIGCAKGPRAPAADLAIPKFDVHTHLAPDAVDLYFGLGRPQGIAGAVNLSGGSSAGALARQLEAASAAPGPVLVFANLDFDGALAPGWVERQVAWLDEAHARGARGLKIFKTFGLLVHDPAGARVPVDDPRLDPIFEEAGRLGMPVAIHAGDPKAFFQPATPSNERWAELSLNPGWSFADRSRFPDWETLYREFEGLVARHPHTTFIGVHFGNDPEEPARVAAMLDRYPNLVIDTAARVGEIGRFPVEKLRAIFLDHRTRILFGTDIAIAGGQVTLGAPEPYQETPATAARFFAAHWRFFETSARGLAVPSPIQGNWKIDGIGLPRDVLEDVYHRNAERLFGLRPLGITLR